MQLPVSLHPECETGQISCVSMPDRHHLLQYSCHSDSGSPGIGATLLPCWAALGSTEGCCRMPLPCRHFKVHLPDIAVCPVHALSVLHAPITKGLSRTDKAQLLAPTAPAQCRTPRALSTRGHHNAAMYATASHECGCLATTSCISASSTCRVHAGVSMTTEAGLRTCTAT